MTGTRDALFLLEDGTHWRGRGFGSVGTSFGEAVFNTGMAGYQEVLTDPSYCQQIVTMTAAHIGNYGMTEEDAESDRIQVAGYVVREAARRVSSWRAQTDLRSALADADVVGVEGVDTRAVTRHLRDRGAMRAAVSTEVLDVDALLPRVLDSPSMVGADLARVVSTTEPYAAGGEDAPHRVVAIDYGIKRNIVRLLAAHGCRVHVLPATATADDVRALEPDGLFLSNGPGDPAAVTYGSEMVASMLGEVPVFGICLGSQLLGRALGAETYKLAFGHRGVNQPIMNHLDGTVEITSHNHGFAVRASSLGEQTGPGEYRGTHGTVRVSHTSLNDDTCEGLVAPDARAFSVQYHPEAAPGPHDARYLFDRFTRLMSGDLTAITEGGSRAAA